MAADPVFLFSDVEGSSARWDRDPAAMATDLARHDSLLRESIERHRGRVFKTAGDAFFAVFPDPEGAARAAVDIQTGIRAAFGDAQTALRVRVALHAGPADERDGDYFGPTLNRLARILAAAHGGQTLLTAALDDPGPGLRRHALGSHRLRSIPVPVALWELTAEGEAPSGREPASLDRGRLAVLGTWPPLLGRDAERARLAALIRDPTARLVTITGTGGVGKTHLAYAVLGETVHSLDLPIALVECAPLSSSDELVAALCAAVGIPDRGDGAAVDRLHQALRIHPVHLLLDNVEHLRTAASTLASLLRAAGETRVLVTSRGPIGIPGERELAVAPLRIGEPVGRDAAVELFFSGVSDDRRRQLDAPEHRAAIEAIAARLDGLPLAIQLASGRARLADPAQILAQLVGGERGAATERRTPDLDPALAETIRWSYDLLSPRKRALLRALGAFAGGCTAARLEQLYPRLGYDPLDAVDDAEALTARHLLRLSPGRTAVRLTMLEPIRAFALAQLAAEPDGGAVVHAAQADLCLDILDPPPTGGGRPDPPPTEELDDERVNIRQAARHLITAGDADAAHRLTGLMAVYWRRRGLTGEAMSLLDAAAELDGPLSGNAHFLAAAFAQDAGDLPRALSGFARAVEVHRRTGDTLGEADAVTLLAAAVAVSREGTARAGEMRASLLTAIDTYRGAQDLPGEAAAWNSLGMVAYWDGDIADAESAYRAALALCEESGDDHQAAICRANIAECLVARDEASAAAAEADAALAALRGIGDAPAQASALVCLGFALAAAGDVSTARGRFDAALGLLEEHPDAMTSAIALLGAASIDGGVDPAGAIHRVDAIMAERGMRLPAFAAKVRDDLSTRPGYGRRGVRAG